MTKPFGQVLIDQAGKIPVRVFYDFALDIAASEFVDDDGLDKCLGIVNEAMDGMGKRIGEEFHGEIQYEALALSKIVVVAAAELLELMHFTQLESEIDEIEGGAA